MYARRKSFNSLQTGKCIQSERLSPAAFSSGLRFNSLQTGKCIQSYGLDEYGEVVYGGFNSLQTGKCIQRLGFETFDIDSAMRFNSLQTGKCIQRPGKFCDKGLQPRFQFPSNGKAYPKGINPEAAIESYLVSIPFKRESVSKDC